MILVDAGPLVALADRTDLHHEACVKALQKMRQPLATVWPALTEAVSLVQRPDRSLASGASWHAPARSLRPHA